MSTYTNSDLLKGDMVIKSTGLADLIKVMSASGFAVNVIPVNDERVRVIITEAKGGFYE